MAPLTRGRTDQLTGVPTALNARHYVQVFFLYDLGTRDHVVTNGYIICSACFCGAYYHGSHLDFEAGSRVVWSARRVHGGAG
jgi:hypothetical protein